MPEVEPTTEVTETDSDQERFPELRAARRIGNIMETIQDEEVRLFIVHWLRVRYGGV